VAVTAGFTKDFTYHFDGEKYLREMVDNQTGGILISAHVGNWEIAGHLLKRLKTKINVVMYDGEYQRIKHYLQHVMGQQMVNVIPVKDDFSHIFLMGNALRNKEIICMHADRFMEGSKVISRNFMGEEAPFPAGPFAIATRFQVPVSFVFAMKESDSHYHLSATPGKIYDGNENALIADYLQELEISRKMV
jgi:predicted LPLAT superfamily acyltransferase